MVSFQRQSGLWIVMLNEQRTYGDTLGLVPNHKYSSCSRRRATVRRGIVSEDSGFDNRSIIDHIIQISLGLELDRPDPFLQLKSVQAASYPYHSTILQRDQGVD
jgi:hypothetical protein